MKDNNYTAWVHFEIDYGAMWNAGITAHNERLQVIEWCEQNLEPGTFGPTLHNGYMSVGFKNKEDYALCMFSIK